MSDRFSTIIDGLHRDLVFFCGGRLSEMGLTTGLMYFVLHAAKHPGATPTEFCDALRLDKAYVTRCLSKLTRDGFFEKHPHPTDGRASRIFVTGKGADVFEACRSMLEEWEGSRLSGLSGSEKEQLFMLLEKIDTADTEGRKKQ